MQVLIRKARVADPQSPHHDKVMDILVEDGIITRIASSVKADAAITVDVPDLCVSPGWVDILADYCEPGYEHKETLQSGMAAAAAGGYTDVLTAPNTQPVMSNQAAIQYLLQRAAGNVVTLHPTGSLSRNAEGKDLAEMLDMRTHGAIAFGDGWKPVQNSTLMMKALEYVTAFNGVLIQVPVDNALAAGGLMNEGPVSVTLGMAGIPELAETLMVYRDVELARYTGSRLHISGITTAASVDMIRRAKADGVSVTCSVTPYHLVLTDEVMRGYDSMYKVSPPLRGESDRKALVAGIKDGTIDCIASHHRPQEWDAKQKELEYAAEGMAVQELTFNIIWDKLKKSLSTERLAELMSIRPRAIFGLSESVINKGNAASLTLFTTTGSHTLAKGAGRSKGVNNPFEGMPLVGKVIGIVNNNKVHLNK